LTRSVSGVPERETLEAVDGEDALKGVAEEDKEDEDKAGAAGTQIGGPDASGAAGGSVSGGDPPALDREIARSDPEGGFRCPRCEESLTEEDLTRGECPACKLPVKAPE
jgi:hypothetical protein